MISSIWFLRTTYSGESIRERGATRTRAFVIPHLSIHQHLDFLHRVRRRDLSACDPQQRQARMVHQQERQSDSASAAP